MTKSEQTVFDRIKADNDAGYLCHQPVGKTKGQRAPGRFGGLRCRVNQKPLKNEQAALERLVERGEVVRWRNGSSEYAIAGHAVLASKAAMIDLPGLAKWVEQARIDYEARQKSYAESEALIRKYLGPA